MVVVFSSMSGAFLTTSNLTVILQSVAVVGIIAVPAAMLLLCGYVDLAVGSIAVLAAICFGRFAGSMPVELAFVLALLVGAGWGAVSGFLICYLDFSPIVVTLGGLAGARGLAELINNSSTKSGFGELFVRLGNDYILGIPLPVYLLGVAFLVGAYFWYAAPGGRHMMAIGANRDAARSLGVAVRRIPWSLYVASGTAAALGGLIVASQLDSASLSIGNGLELQVLTAVLLGGVAFTGGRGNLVGVLAGVLFIGTLQNGLVVINISPFLLGVVTGLALVFAAGLEVLYQRLDRIQIDDEAEQEG